MYSVNHIIWLLCCASLIASILSWLLWNKPPMKNVLSICCVVCVLSELTKVFSSITLVPSADGLKMYPYLEMSNLPLHLCSIHLGSIFYCRFGKEGKAKETLLAFMYPTCSIGAAIALFVPTILSDADAVSRAFTNPHAYEYFLYHTMLIILGLYILLGKQVNLRPKHYVSSITILCVLAFFSLYINSMFASPTYIAGELISVDFVPNLFFTYAPPIDIPLTELWHWYVYLAIISLLAISLITLLYIPIFRSVAKEKRYITQ